MGLELFLGDAVQVIDQFLKQRIGMNIEDPGEPQGKYDCQAHQFRYHNHFLAGESQLRLAPIRPAAI